MRAILLALTLVALTTTAVSTSWHAPAEHHGGYVGPGTLVAAFSAASPGAEASATFVDNGAVVCEDTDGDGTYDKGNGGLCIHFWEMRGDSILVEDALAYRDVAFQVCVDANGDGICGSSAFSDPLGLSGCRDALVFSHNGFNGGFDNPMYLPSFLEQAYWQCGGLGFPGYIVIICAGAHQTFGDPDGHTHTVAFGQVYSTYEGTWPKGDYCGAPTDAKKYVLR